MIDSVDDAARTFEDAVAGLRADELNAASRLPGWSRRHVIAHVALDAEAFVRVAAESRRGDGVAFMYPGGTERRDTDSERLAAISTDEFVARLRVANVDFAAAWSSEPPAGRSATANGHPEFSASTIPLRRLRELQVHLIDLDPDGLTPHGWLDGFVDTDLPLHWSTVAHRTTRPVSAIDEHARLWTANGDPDDALQPISVHRGLLLAWVLDRTGNAGLPRLAPWGNRSCWEHLDP